MVSNYLNSKLCNNVSLINITNISITSFEKIQNKEKILVNYGVTDVCKIVGRLLFCRECDGQSIYCVMMWAAWKTSISNKFK